MTRRLYYTDAYRDRFTSSVVERSGDGMRVYLEETAFYPTSGGQPFDGGTLGGVRVVDVIDEGDRIAHLLGAPLPESATTVEGAIDWPRRFDHMQQHTGQHLLSAVFEDLFGWKTVSVHFGPDSSTLDVHGDGDGESDGVSRAALRVALRAGEARANALVGESRAVAVSFEDAASAAGLRKATDREGTLRIVSIDGIDRSACGGTHVRTTAEIGVVLIRSAEKVRRATRIEFVCGTRAVARAGRDFESLSRVAASLSASLDDAAELVAAQLDRVRESDNVRKRLEKELAVFRARERYAGAVPDATGLRTIVIRDASSADELRAIAQAAYALPRVVVVGALGDPPSVFLASSEDSGVDAGRLLKERLSAVGGRGGGSPRLAQGSVPDASALARVVAELVNRPS